MSPPASPESDGRGPTATPGRRFGTLARALAVAAVAGAATWTLTGPPSGGDPTGSGLLVDAGRTPAVHQVTRQPSAPPASARSASALPVVITAPPGTRAAVPPPPPSAGAVPERLTIEQLDLDLPIEPVGVDAAGAMALPADPSVVGWYRFGAPPGATAGSAVLAAHVDSARYGVGPFVGISSLRFGSVITVTTDDGRVGYRVDRVDQVPRLRLDTAALFDRTGPHRLRLVTCGGPYDAAAGGYADNVIVTAVRL